MKRTKIAPEVLAERERIAGEARLAKAASAWMGAEAFDMLIRRIHDPECDPYGKSVRRLARLSRKRGERGGEGVMRMKWWEWIAFMLIWLSHRPLRHPTMRTKDPGVVWCPDCLRTYRARRGGKA